MRLSLPLFLFILLGSLSIAFFCPLWAQEGGVNEARHMIIRGDSLLESGKPVAALAMYRGAEERSFDPCLMALARTGIAAVHTQSGNPTLASSALQLASSGLLACGEENRLKPTLLAADLWLEMQQEEKAASVLFKELKVHPNNLDILTRIAEIHFITGEWNRSIEFFEKCLDLQKEQTTHFERANWLSHLVQIQIVQDHSLSDSLLLDFEAAITNLPQSQNLTHRIHIQFILAAEGLNRMAVEWAEKILDLTPVDDPESRCVAHLRLADAAQRAHSPLEALIGFHEAIKAARHSNDPDLLAEALRQKAQFETERENYIEALFAMQTVDSLNTAIIAAFRASNKRPVRAFTEQMLPEPDPFDRAAFSLATGTASDHSKGAWPWLAALFAIALIAMSRSHRDIRANLKKERRRLIRLRSLVPTDRLPEEMEHPIPTSGHDLGASSLMPNGTLVFTHDDDPNVQPIDEFLQSIDSEISQPMEWSITASTHLFVGPEVRTALRNLLRSFIELSSQQETIEVQIEQHEENWNFSLSSDHTEASKALRGLFHGKDAVASSRWNELHAQLRQLAGRIQIERMSPIRERLTITLPYV